LSVIRGKVEGVLDGICPATSHHLEPTLEEIRLLSHLVEDLNLLALAETGQLDLEKQVLDIGDLLRDAQVNFGPQAENVYMDNRAYHYIASMNLKVCLM
jgi:two-component system sensor histidine kinase BaeS